MEDLKYEELHSKIYNYLEKNQNEDIILLFRIFKIYKYDAIELINRWSKLMNEEDKNYSSDWYNYIPTKEAEEATKQIGIEADKIGGFPLMQAIFYLYINFVSDNEFKRVGTQNLNYLWSGIGSWQA